MKKNNLELIYAIPGLGTTKDLFKNISVPNLSLKVLKWPQPKPEWTLNDYAKAFISQIDRSKAVNLMGVSFGGMLCCEIADIITVNKVILVSSCKNKNELPARIKFFRFFPLQKALPDNYYRKIIPKLGWIVGFKKADLPDFKTMIQAMPPNYFKYCINMIVNWEKNENLQVIYHIHGKEDYLLPHNKIKNFKAIENGNHAMILYKANEVNSILKKLSDGSK